MDIEWKEELYGIDFINSLVEKEKENVIGNCRLIPIAIKKPTFTYETLLGLPIQEFMEIYIGFMKKYKNSLFQGVKKPTTQTLLEKTKGIQFAKKEDFSGMNTHENNIEFSTVVRKD